MGLKGSAARQDPGSPGPAPLWRRLVYSVLPLLLLLGTVEGVSAIIGHFVRQRHGVIFEDDLPTPLRAGTTFYSEGDYAIVAVGDSWTFGVFVEPEETWPSQLQRTLREQYGAQATVVNLGQPGANGLRIAMDTAAFLSRYSPDLVIYMAGQNPSAEEVILSGHELSTAGRISRFFRHFATYRLVSQLSARARARSDRLLHDRRLFNMPGMSDMQNWDYRRMDIEAGVDRMDQLTTAAGSDLLVVTYPVLEEFRGPEYLRRNIDIGVLSPMLAEAAQDRGLPCIDLYDLFDVKGLGRAAIHDPTVGPHTAYVDVHPSALGYAAMAEEIARRIADDFL